MTSWNQANWPTNSYEWGYLTSIEDLYYALEKHGPIYAYYWDRVAEDAHLVVVTGINLNKNIIYINNPNSLERGQQTYEEFLSRYATVSGSSNYPFYAYLHAAY